MKPQRPYVAEVPAPIYNGNWRKANHAWIDQNKQLLHHYSISKSAGLLVIPVIYFFMRTASKANSYQHRVRLRLPLDNLNLVRAAILLSAFLSLQSVAVQTGGYSVDGNIRFRNFDAAGQVLMVTTSRFSVAVGETSWAIKVVPGDKSVEDYYSVSFDGSNIYHYANLETGIFLRRQKGERVGQNTGIGGVMKGVIPHFPNAHEAGPIWLAFVSRNYWPTVKKNQVEPAAVLSVNSGSDMDSYLTLHQEAQWTLYPKAPFLPERVVYFDDGVFREPGSTVPHETILWPEPYRRGFTNTIYEASDFALFEGMSIPQHAKLVTFSPRRKGGKNASDLRLRNEYTILVDRVEKTNPALAFPPQVPGPTFFTDYRFAQDQSKIKRVQYLRGERFLTDAEAHNSPEYGTALRQNRAANPLPGQGKGWARYLVIGSLCALAVIFGAVVIKCTQQTKHKTEKI